MRCCRCNISEAESVELWSCKPACPGATGCAYATVFPVYECLTFHHRILPCQPALARRDVGMQLFSLLMNASLCITASCHARSGPGSNGVLAAGLESLWLGENDGSTCPLSEAQASFRIPELGSGRVASACPLVPRNGRRAQARRAGMKNIKYDLLGFCCPAFHYSMWDAKS